MNHDSPDREEERLREIIAAADRDVPEPDREFLAGLKTRSTLRFVEAAADNSKRSRIMAKIKRFAPRAIAAGALLAIGATVVLLAVGSNDGAAWAKVRKRIEQAQGMRMTVSVTGPDKKVYRARSVLATGGRMRQEMSVNGQTMVMISDLRKGVILNLLPDQKIAITTRLKDMPKAMREQVTRQGDQLAAMKKMVRNAEKQLGEKTIDGVKLKGYRVANESMTMDIWVDAETARPVHMEIEMTDARMKGVMSDIEIVRKVDPDRFSTDVPDGYTVQKQPDVSMKPAGVKELTELLSAWAELTDGPLPDALDPVLFVTVAQEAAKRLAASGTPPKQRKALMDRISQTVSARLVNAMVLKQVNETFHYQGKGVKLGEKATPVLWYKPKGKAKYVVIYGDLHVERVAKKDLPPKRKAATKPAPK
jgi:outer membrane lipoprotein-sorting protein